MISALTVALDCEVFASDTMLYVNEANLSTYADASVVCGPVLTMVAKKNGKSLGEAVINPTIIVEVLSESTERYDRDGKFGAYSQLPSLQEYVLVTQDERRVEVFRRPAAGADWTCEVGRSGGAVTIHGASIEVDSIYARESVSR